MQGTGCRVQDAWYRMMDIMERQAPAGILKDYIMFTGIDILGYLEQQNR